MSQGTTTTAAGDPVPAVTEADATGETAALYADIRETLGVAVVNLVWRHLATIPGALPWCWGTVRPAYRDGSVVRAAARLRDAMPLPALPPAPACVFAAVGIGNDDGAAIGRVLAAYDHTNAMALIATSALLLALEGAVSPGGSAGPEVAMRAIPGPLPSLLAAGGMTPAAAALVGDLDALGRRPGDRVVPSMYRQLAHWPAYLALAHGLLAPLQADGRLPAVIAATLAMGRTQAHELASSLARAEPPLDPSARIAARTAVETFAPHAIARMVPIATLLRRSLSP